MKAMPVTLVSLRLALVAVTAAAAMLAGCGLAETTTVATAEAEAAAKQAQEGKKLEEKVQRDIDAAQKTAADARAAAEAESQ